MTKHSYTEKHIEVLGEIKGIRKRPEMYIGDTGESGFHHLLFEIIDNSVDEALAGFAKTVKVVLHADGSATVEDDGRGIPVGPVKDTDGKERPAVEVVMTRIHSGAKFGGQSYKVSGGLHGVGLTVVNALSEWLEAEIRRDGAVYRIRFSKGVKTGDLKSVGKATSTGTRIRFKPDPEIFGNQRFSVDKVKERLYELSFLTPGVTYVLERETRRNGEIRVSRVAEFRSEEGIGGYLKSMLTREFEDPDGAMLTHDIISTRGEEKGSKGKIEVEVALAYVDDSDSKVEGFANCVKTEEGGYHVQGLFSGLFKAVRKFVEEENIGSQMDRSKISSADVRAGLRAVVSVRHPDPKFFGQTKGKLVSRDAKEAVEKVVFHWFYEYLKRYPQIARQLAQKFVEAARVRIAEREIRRRKRTSLKSVLPGKLADCTTTNLEKRELFIVEGESAGGSAKQGRDRTFQAILPLKGKILNVEKAHFEKIIRSKEIEALATAIGARPVVDKSNGKGDVGYRLEEPRYGKIIIMTDADVDGLHIRTLLLTFFYRYFRRLIEEGRVYIAKPPLYRIEKGGKVYYAYSDAERDGILRRIGTDGTRVQRYKGLGEMNPGQLWETTMDPSRRILKKVTVEDAAEASKTIEQLMGQKAEYRRKFIEENARFAKDIDI